MINMKKVLYSNQYDIVKNPPSKILYFLDIVTRCRELYTDKGIHEKTGDYRNMDLLMYAELAELIKLCSKY